MIRLLAILLACISFRSLAQFSYVEDAAYPVTVDNHVLKFPFAGGLNSAQFNKLDIDGDHDEDLVIFDRMANKIITFKAEDNGYHYAPEYELYFPATLQNFVLIRDYNQDGKGDIFTGDPLGIKVFTNTTDGGTMSWEQFMFTTASGTKLPVILTQGFSLSNLQLQFDDIPSISDIDNDGDIDILTMRYPSGGTIEFHQNMSQENYGHSDSLQFVRITQAWGDVRECECGEFAFNDENCSDGGREKHSGGKSLLALDANGNGSQDMVISEADCKQLFLLNNGAASTEALIDHSQLFPSDSSLFPIFPAAYFEDVDFDGQKDIIVSANVFRKEQAFTDFRRSVSFYKNNGTTASPSFEYVTNRFLQTDMIDAGDNSVPAFADEDGDGDLDLFIGSGNGFIQLYENTGTSETPAFTLADDDYFNLRAKGYTNVKIQFTDVDHSGSTDLLFTATLASSGSTRMYFVANQHSGRLDFDGQTEYEFNFTVTFNDNVLATDVNQDGYADLLVGRSDGALQYWSNNGTAGIPGFTLEDNAYVPADEDNFSQYLSAATGDLDGDGTTDLVIGDQLGLLKIIPDYRNEENREAEKVNLSFKSLTDSDTTRNLGGRLWPTVVSLANSAKPSIIAGNTLGGLRILLNDDGGTLPEVPAVFMYPNPVTNAEKLVLETDRPLSFYITNSVGQIMTDAKKVSATGKHYFNVSQLAAGLYFVHFSTAANVFVQRLVID